MAKISSNDEALNISVSVRVRPLDVDPSLLHSNFESYQNVLMVRGRRIGFIPSTYHKRRTSIVCATKRSISATTQRTNNGVPSNQRSHSNTLTRSASSGFACQSKICSTFVYNNCFAPIECHQAFDKYFGSLREKANRSRSPSSQSEPEPLLPANNLSTQSTIYKGIGEPALNAFFSGYHACVLAYGQTGSGKTYSMLGPSQASVPIAAVLAAKGTGESRRGSPALSTAARFFPVLNGSTLGSSFSMDHSLCRSKSRTPSPQPLHPRDTNEDVGTLSMRHLQHHDERGLIVRIAENLFSLLNSSRERDPSFYAEVCCSYYQIFREKAWDLLRGGASESSLQKLAETQGKSIEDFELGPSASSGRPRAGEPLRVRCTNSTGPYLEGLRRIPLRSVADMLAVLEIGVSNRAVASTHHNVHSSRSHAIFTLYLRRTNSDNPKSNCILSSTLCLVDLAGSERIGALVSGDLYHNSVSSVLINNNQRLRTYYNMSARTRADGCIPSNYDAALAGGSVSKAAAAASAAAVSNAMKSEEQQWQEAAARQIAEASDINSSLSALGKVINVLAQAQAAELQARRRLKRQKQKTTDEAKDIEPHKLHYHIPYRDSLLTLLLKNCFGGSARTFMLAAVSPFLRDIDETLSTLRFSALAKTIVNSVVKNSSKRQRQVVAALQSEILRLKQQLCQAHNLIRELGSDSAMKDISAYNLPDSPNRSELALNDSKLTRGEGFEDSSVGISLANPYKASRALADCLDEAECYSKIIADDDAFALRAFRHRSISLRPEQSRAQEEWDPKTQHTPNGGVKGGRFFVGYMDSDSDSICSGDGIDLDSSDVVYSATTCGAVVTHKKFIGPESPTPTSSEINPLVLSKQCDDNQLVQQRLRSTSTLKSPGNLLENTQRPLSPPSRRQASTVSSDLAMKSPYDRLTCRCLANSLMSPDRANEQVDKSKTMESVKQCNYESFIDDFIAEIETDAKLTSEHIEQVKSSNITESNEAAIVAARLKVASAHASRMAASSTPPSPAVSYLSSIDHSIMEESFVDKPLKDVPLKDCTPQKRSAFLLHSPLDTKRSRPFPFGSEFVVLHKDHVSSLETLSTCSCSSKPVVLSAAATLQGLLGAQDSRVPTPNNFRSSRLSGETSQLTTTSQKDTLQSAEDCRLQLISIREQTERLCELAKPRLSGSDSVVGSLEPTRSSGVLTPISGRLSKEDVPTVMADVFHQLQSIQNSTLKAAERRTGISVKETTSLAAQALSQKEFVCDQTSVFSNENEKENNCNMASNGQNSRLGMRLISNQIITEPNCSSKTTVAPAPRISSLIRLKNS